MKLMQGWILTEATLGKSHLAVEPTQHQVPTTEDITLGENICSTLRPDSGEIASGQILPASEGLHD